MKKAIGYALLFVTVMELWAPDWWTRAKEEAGRKIEQVTTK